MEEEVFARDICKAIIHKGTKRLVMDFQARCYVIYPLAEDRTVRTNTNLCLLQ